MDNIELKDGIARPASLERLAYSIQEAATVTGIGRTTLYGLIKSGRLASRKIGQRRVIRALDLHQLLKGEE